MDLGDFANGGTSTVFRCTILMGTPTMHVDMTTVPDLKKKDLSSLRLALTAGAICPEELMRDMGKAYSCKVCVRDLQLRFPLAVSCMYR